MPWYSPTIRQMTPAELKRDKQILDEYMRPFEAEYERLHPSEEELKRQQAEAQAKSITDGWDRFGHGVIKEEISEWGL